MGLPGCVFPGCVLPGCGFPGCVFPGCVLAPPAVLYEMRMKYRYFPTVNYNLAKYKQFAGQFALSQWQIAKIKKMHSQNEKDYF